MTTNLSKKAALIRNELQELIKHEVECCARFPIDNSFNDLETNTGIELELIDKEDQNSKSTLEKCEKKIYQGLGEEFEKKFELGEKLIKKNTPEYSNSIRKPRRKKANYNLGEFTQFTIKEKIA